MKARHCGAIVIAGAVASACSLIPKSGGGTDPGGAPPPNARIPAPAAATDDGAPAAVVAAMPAVPKSAAHPTEAWFVARTGEIPGFGLGGTGHAEAPPATVMTFVLDAAVADIAPACLRDYQLTRTAGKLAKVGAIEDQAGIDAARAAIAAIAPDAEAELAGAEFSDHENGLGAAQRAAEALSSIADATALAVDDGNRALGSDALAGWVELLDVCFDATKPAVIERNLGRYHKLLATGKRPARGAKVASRPIHPGLRTLLRLLGEQMPLGDFAALLAIDPSDTLRGKNTDVGLFAADISIRELTVKTLELCDDKPDATKVAKLAAIKSEASYRKALDVAMGLGSTDREDLCLGMAQNNLGLAIEDVSSQFDYQREGINSHPYYARGLFSGWTAFLSGFATLKMPPAEVAELTQDLVSRTVKRLRQLPRRKETSREPD